MKMMGKVIDARELFKSRAGMGRSASAENIFGEKDQPNNLVRLCGRSIGPETTDLEREMVIVYRRACALNRRSIALLKEAERSLNSVKSAGSEMTPTSD